MLILVCLSNDTFDRDLPENLLLPTQGKYTALLLPEKHNYHLRSSERQFSNLSTIPPICGLPTVFDSKISKVHQKHLFNFGA